METVERCELCGDTEFFPFLKGRDRLHGIGSEFQLVRCLGCGLIFIDPRPDREEVKRFYPAAYGPHAETGGPSHSHRLSPLRRRLYSLFYNYPHDNRGNGILLRTLLLPVKWAAVKNIIPFQGEGKILDIGAGSGSFLAFMKTLGWDPYGVDVSSKAVERARALGLRMFQGEVSDASFPDRFFDVITLRSVLEHVHHPVETLHEVHRILRDQGIVYIVVPNIASLNFWFFGRFWYGLESPRHLYAYSPSTMRRLAQKTGFAVLSMRFRSSTRGLRGSLQYWYDDRKGFKGNKPFMSSKTVRLVGKIWRRATDLFRLGDTVEYRLGKMASGRSTK
jgi:2-polyprenyl-3-methyl-5-hydroxy-6-metoxy-1,4-benzoquinol methylase